MRFHDINIRKIKYRDNLPVSIRILNIEEYPWRYHDAFTIAFVLAGEVGLKLSYSHYKLSKGDVHIIHNEDVYGFRKLSASNLVMLMHFDLEYFKTEFPNLDMELFTTKITANPAKYNEQTQLKQKLVSIVSRYAKEDPGYENRIAGEASQVLKLLYSHFRDFVLNQERREFEYKRSYDTMQSERISAIVSYIYENYDSKLSLSDIAKNVNLDKYYLSHLFQRYVGENFRTFVSMVRVEQSETMLLETDASISQIAADVGFSDTKYFTENFGIWFGCSPKEYREAFREKLWRKRRRMRKNTRQNSMPRFWQNIREKFLRELM